MSPPDLAGHVDLAALVIIAFGLAVVILAVAVAVFTRRAVSLELHVACKQCYQMLGPLNERLDQLEHRVQVLESTVAHLSRHWAEDLER